MNNNNNLKLLMKTELLANIAEIRKAGLVASINVFILLPTALIYLIWELFHVKHLGG